MILFPKIQEFVSFNFVFQSMNENFSEKDISIVFFKEEEADDFEEILTSVLGGRFDRQLDDGLFPFFV